MAHPRARLNVLGRELLVTRVEVLGWPVATAAEAQGISRATGHKWFRRFRLEGSAGLADRSSRPHRSPRALPTMGRTKECPWAAFGRGATEKDLRPGPAPGP